MRLLLPLLILPVLPLAAEPWSEEDVRFFEERVRPVLAERCYECHSAEAEKLKGGLYLDSRAGVLEGGDSGPAVVPGDAEASLLMEAVRYGNVDLEMPPKTRLSDEQVDALAEWINRGCPWPEGEGGEVVRKAFDLEGRKAAHWCWQPVQAVEPPEVSGKSWPRSPIDRFILAELEERGLSPAPDADRRTFIRRLSFDLTGLPPSPEEVEAFVNDSAPGAVERLVDRLLASPHFGEKWARHWLDLVRYGESYGHEFDYTIPHAWRYRDYLIRAFNADVPYNNLLEEHIAGDLLEAPRQHPDKGTDESVIGTGFWWLTEAVHAPTDIRADEADRIDNQLDVFSRAFLGLTVSCARCHDHKFDAIPASDYFALSGFLQGTRRGKAMLDPGGKIATGARELRQLQAEASALVPQGEPPPAAPGEKPADEIAGFDGGLPDGWTMSGEAFAVTPADRPVFSLGERQVARRGVVDSGLYGKKLQGVLRSPNFTLTGPEIHLFMRAQGPVEVRVVIDGYFMHEFHPLLTDGTRLEEKTITTGGQWAWRKIAHDLKRYLGHEVYLEFSDLGGGSIAIGEITYTEHPVPAQPNVQLPPEAVGNFQRIIARADEIESELPAPVRVLAAADGPGCNERIHIRGNSSNLGEEVPRAFLSVLGGEPVTSAGSGRLELARAVTAPDNPLTSRVMVNRLWHHLTGRGIVATVDDFGEMGMEPSHPELLDWQAADFVRSGWSLKKAIRQIVLSRTYGMSCTPAESAGPWQERDPENIYLHKFRVRRLPAEGIRDGLLAVSGRLDRRMFGPPVPVHLTSFMEGRGRPGQSGPVDGEGRRSVYLSVRRNFLPTFTLAFDFPYPSTTRGRRSVSNVPAQSLALMNDPFVIEQARVWAGRLCGETSDADARIGRAYAESLSRLPSDDERALAHGFLESQAAVLGCDGDDPRVWADFCHLLINQKEFIYLR